MSVNIFGSGPVTTTATTISRRGPPGIGFKYLDDEGNFDIEDKRLANVANPLEENDVVTKIYTDKLVTEIRSKVDETSSSFEIINEALSQLQMECKKININIENKLNTLKKKITELKSEDDHIKNFVEEVKSQLFDIHNNVLTKEGFESILKMINKQISTLEKNLNNKNNIQVCAYETIIFQTNSKLELGKFPFVLGMKGAASKKTGYVMPYDGFIDTIILTSQDIDQHVSVKLLINGDEYSLPLDKYGDEFFNKIRVNNLHLNEGDIIQIQANVDTNNVKMHVVQVFVGYNLVNKNIMLKDQPIEDEEVEFIESYHKDEKNMYEFIFSNNHSGIEENMDSKNIISDDFGNVVHSSDNTDTEIKRKYGDNIS